VVQTESCTLIVVARAPSSANPIWRHLVSNFGRDNGTGGLKWGASLAFKLDAADVRLTLGLLATAAGGAASSTGAVAPAALGSLSFSAARVDAVARTASIDNKTTGVARSATYANTYKPELNGEFYIGSAAGLRADTAGVDVEVMFAAIYSRALSDAELAAVYQSVKIFYAARGLTI
ncbi:hypothetical protein, partial [Pseudomonas putida]|uniref:hypothetical protein n=1 Tax=Pseudomonas putida TaxID=303 RepID=UPI0018AA0717